MSNSFYLKIRNKGLGLATKVETTFTINLNELRELLEFENSGVKVVVSKVSVRDDGRKFINVHFNHAEYKSSFIVFEKETEWLGVIDNVEVTDLHIPRQILVAFEIYNFLRNFKMNQDFPVLSVSFQYENIHNKSLESDFLVGLLHVGNRKNYSVYRVAYNQI